MTPNFECDWVLQPFIKKYPAKKMQFYFSFTQSMGVKLLSKECSPAFP